MALEDTDAAAEEGRGTSSARRRRSRRSSGAPDPSWACSRRSMNSGDILVRLKPRERARRGRRKRSSTTCATSSARPCPTPRSSSCSCCRTCSATSKARRRRSKSRSSATIRRTLERSVRGDRAEGSRPIHGVVDVVGLQRGSPEVTWQVDPVAAGRLGLTVEQVSDAARRTPGWATSRPSCGCYDRTIPRARALSRRDPLRRRRGLRRRLIRGANGKLTPASALVHDRADAAARPSCMRENLRQMALVTARLEGRDLGSAVARDPDDAGRR